MCSYRKNECKDFEVEFLYYLIVFVEVKSWDEV